MDKGSRSGSGIFPDPDPDPGDPKRPDPTGCETGSATQVQTVPLWQPPKVKKCNFLGFRPQNRLLGGLNDPKKLSERSKNSEKPPFL